MQTQAHDTNAHAHTFPPGNSGSRQNDRCHEVVPQRFRLKLFPSTFLSPPGGQCRPNQGRERARSLDPLAFLWEGPCWSPSLVPGYVGAYPSVPWGQSRCSLPAAWKAVSLAPLPGAGQARCMCPGGCQAAEGNPVARERQGLVHCHAETFQGQNRSCSEPAGSPYDSGPRCLLLRAPSQAPLEKGLVGLPRPQSICNYLARKPRSCCEQVSADKPMSLPRDRCS